MAGFLDEVRRDLSLAELEKRHLQRSTESLSFQVNTLTDEATSNERKFSYIANMFRQRRIELEQTINYFRRQEREQNEELSRTEHKIFYLTELETLKGPLEFGRFPEEIRRMILEWTLVEDSPIYFETNSQRTHRSRGLAIFRTSKQIHAEAIAIFYRQNKFEMDATNLKRFLSKKRVKYVRHLSLSLDSDISITRVLRAVERCQDLRSLHICLISVPRFHRHQRCDEQRMRSLNFRRTTALGQISTEVCEFSKFEGILESLRSILQSILEEGGFEKPLRRCSRIDSNSTDKIDGPDKK